MMLRNAMILSFGLALATAATAQQVLPPPTNLSTEARSALAADAARPNAAKTMAERRARSDAIQHEIGDRMRDRYKVAVEDGAIEGVPVRIFTPKGWRKGRPLLMNLHGGGFMVDSGSLTENIPIAALTGYRVVAVLYRLSPEHRFPAAVEDGLAVYRALLKQAPARRIGLYGTSAGAILGPELIARLKAATLPLPGALGMFSGSADLTGFGDSVTLFGDPGMTGLARVYAGSVDLADPLLSPARGDLSGWPPTLCLTSSRDVLLSATADFCRRLDAAGGVAQLVMFDGLPHAFWAYVEAPESDAAFATMARFLTAKLGASGK